MTPEKVDRLKLKVEAHFDPLKKPERYSVENLPPHLEAEISSSPFGYQYRLTRKGDQTYTQKQACGSGEAAFEALKKLLTWEPV